MKKSEWAYIAGFIDGEGCIMAFTHPQSRTIYPRITASQVRPEPLQWIHDRLGGYLHFQSYEHRGYRGIWRIRWDARKAERVLRGIEPYLILKQDQAQLALTLFELEHDEREEVKLKLQELKRG